MDQLTDEELIRESLSGSTQAFDQLVVRYQDRLVHSLEHSFGSRDDALEVAQQAFVLAWQRLSTFRGEAGFYSWLYRIARNAAATRARRRRHSTRSLNQLSESAGYEPVDERSSASPDHETDRSETVAAVRDALQQLAEEFRTPLVLKEIDGFSYEEIAAILDIPMGTVRSRLFRARQELAERLSRILKES